MAARRQPQLGDGSVFVAIVVLLLVVGLIIKYIWWVAGAGALVGLFFVGRPVARGVQERRELAERQEAELQRRADRRHRWMLAGDPRAIYGEKGADAMRKVAPPPALPDGDDGEELEPIATLATTPAELVALERDKPQAWQWALFTSILVQRTAPLLPRLRDSELGFTPADTTRVHSGRELAGTLLGLIDEMRSTIKQVHGFMASPAFMGALADPADGTPPDAEAVTHVAHRVMDYQERLLELSERCRRLSASSQYTEILADCARLLDAPLQGYREFIADMVDVVEALPKVLQHATDDVNMGSVVLDIDLDSHLAPGLFKRLVAMSKS